MQRKPRPKRRGFSVGDQLVQKLGPGPFGALLDELQRRTVKSKPARRRRPRRKAVTS
jgi:hypothetical protein